MKTNNENKPKPHPHAELIKAWADGATIQSFCKEFFGWIDEVNSNPEWDPSVEYRIKPEENEPWKPEEGGSYLFVNSCGEVYERVWESSRIDEKRYENGNCFHSQSDAEATAERVKAALKGEDFNTPIGEQKIWVTEHDIEGGLQLTVNELRDRFRELSRENEKLKLKISAPSDTNFQLDGKPLTDGEVALIKALRAVKIARIPEYRTSVLCFPSEDTDTVQVWCSDTPVAFLTSSLGGISKDKAIVDAIKQIKSEQELNNETQKQQ